jgi:hypothetical protein
MMTMTLRFNLDRFELDESGGAQDRRGDQTTDQGAGNDVGRIMGGVKKLLF